ncbi:MAG: hypothetical protein HYZ19_04310 [Rhodocyclales bacterium]|nr:hypothetical protein [Rhodocyclales bacterium]
MKIALRSTTARDTAAEGPPQDPGLCAALEKIRLLAAESKLLALNAALESAWVGTDAVLAEEMELLAARAGATADDADRVGTVVETLLQQIQSAASLARR